MSEQLTDLSEATTEQVETFKFETMYSPKYKKPGKDIGNPKLKKYGQELDVREWINENNVDCEIYETLEKYGTIKQKPVDSIRIVGEMENLDLRKYLDRKIAEEDLWKSLPIEIRKDFNNDPNKFMEEGLDYMKNKKAEEEAKIAKAAEIKTLEQTNNEPTGE